MKKLQVSLPDDLRGRIEAAAAKSGNSLGEEIRQRLERTLTQDADPETSKLFAALTDFPALVRGYTGYRWHEHRAATRVFRRAILARLMRHWGKSVEQEVFAPGELKPRMVDTDDPDTIGISLEAAHFQLPPMTEERRREIDAAIERTMQEVRERNGMKGK
jgi:plasmid stability protein